MINKDYVMMITTSENQYDSTKTEYFINIKRADGVVHIRKFDTRKLRDEEMEKIQQKMVLI